MLPRLGSALRATPAFLAQVGSAPTELTPIAGAHLAELPAYAREHLASDPLAMGALAASDPVFVLPHRQLAAFRASNAYLRFHRQLGFEHHMVVRLGARRLATPGTLVIGLARDRREGAFDDDDVRGASLVAAALEGALERLACTRGGPAAELTPAETRVLQCLVDGLSNDAIARRLLVSVSTVKTHVHRILRKLAVRSRLEAVAAARGSRPPFGG